MSRRYRHPRCEGRAMGPAVGPLLWLLLAAPAAAEDVDVLILQPRSEEAVFGEVPIVADVLTGETVTEVIFLVDGVEVATLTAPPWRLRADVGQENVEHRFEVVAHTASGAEGRGMRVTPPIAVDARLDLELQQLYITVTRGADRVLDLRRDAFRVLDDGIEQRMVTFERGDVPLTAALLVDASYSMVGERLRLAVSAARQFVADMKPLDEAALLLFSDRLLWSTPFVGDTGPLSAALESVTAHGGTALNDHLYLALKRLEARQGRRVVILLSDGVDVESSLSMDDVLWMTRRSQALVYWIRLREEEEESASRFTAWRNPEAHARETELLAQAVAESGGRVVPIAALGEAETVFREILRELRDQYVIGYYPSVNLDDGRWHDVKVRVPSGLSVRTREGYIDF